MARLGDVVKIEASSKSVVGERFWLLNLDMVEQQTGNVIDYNYVGKDALNGSIIQFDTGCILYSKLRPNLNKVVIPDQDGFATSEMLPLRPNTKMLTREYLTAFLRSDSFVTWAVSKTAGAKMPRLGTKELLSKEIPLPGISEQTRIAGQFAKVDELIALRKEQLAKLDQLVKSRFIELFGNYSETAKLSDVAIVSGGLTKNAKRDKLPLRMPYLRVANVSFASIDVSEMLDIGLTTEEYEKTLLQDGDLLFVEGNGSPDQIGRVAVWKNEIVPCVHQNHLIKSRFNRGVVTPIFAMHYFMSHKGRDQIKSKAVSTSGLYTLSVSKISDLLIPLPPIELQEQFTAFVEQTDKSKLAIQQSLEKLELLKKSLMQEYFG